LLQGGYRRGLIREFHWYANTPWQVATSPGGENIRWRYTGLPTRLVGPDLRLYGGREPPKWGHVLAYEPANHILAGVRAPPLAPWTSASRR
jgi:hypothetical protein